MSEQEYTEEEIKYYSDITESELYLFHTFHHETKTTEIGQIRKFADRVIELGDIIKKDRNISN